MKNVKRNYLDEIPEKNAEIPWNYDGDGRIVLQITNKGLANKIAQIAFGKPPISHIELDSFGSFIWTQIDGEKTIYELGQDLRLKFGNSAEPLYARLAIFFKTLVEQKYIKFKK